MTGIAIIRHLPYCVKIVEIFIPYGDFSLFAFLKMFDPVDFYITG